MLYDDLQHRLSGHPLRGNHQCVCVICMKYRIILLIIIIIISLGQISLSYIANPHTHTHTHTHARARTHTHAHTRAHTRTHTRTHARTHAHAHRRRHSGCCCSMRQTVTQLTPLFVAGRSFIQINTCAGNTVSARFWVFFAFTKLLARTETRTRDMMCFQSIRTVCDISRNDRARIATSSLRTVTYLWRIIV